jgi:hypothetical protein
MAHQMAQAGWQAMIDKSARIFETLLGDFMAALAARTRAGSGGVGVGGAEGEAGAHLAHLLERLDFNGFYTKTLGARMAGVEEQQQQQQQKQAAREMRV